jgi:iron complex outermembrane receptor protein
MMRPLLLMSTAAAALLAVPAYAQDTTNDQAAAAAGPTGEDAGADQSQDVIVTALKREQTLIDVPQSVSVVSGASLERNSATTFQDYLKLIPGLQASQSNPGEARLVLRGINTGGVAATVSTYIDETPFGSSTSLVNGAILSGELDTFDVARVEVLRGPQGTLYGASSLGGVIKYVTATPDTTKVEGRARGGVETVDGGGLSYMGSALVNVPLGDTLAVRASGFYRDMAGFIDSIGTSGSDVQKDINSYKSYGGRVSALFKPSTDFSVRLTALLQNLDSRAGSDVESDPINFNTLYNRFTQSQYVPTFTNVAYRLYTGTITGDLGFATVTSATSYGELHETLRDDFTAYYGTLLGLYGNGTDRAVDIGLAQRTNTDRFTQELRLASNGDGMFDWLIGGYYNKEDGELLQRLDAFDPGTLTVFAGLPQLADIALRSHYEEIAGFANATVHFGERFDLTLGGRYSHNDQNARQTATGLLGSPEASSRSSEDVFTWSAAPKFKLSDRASLYARVAKGFRPGGPNVLPPGAPAGTPTTFDSDSIISYEVGFKAETNDRAFGIDIAAFHIDWSDIQLLAQVNGYGVNTNGGSAVSNGVEFTATMRPTRGLTASVNGAITDAKLTDDTDAAAVGGRDGDKLPFTPRYSVAGNLDYDWSLGGETTAYVGGSIRLVGNASANYSPTYLAIYGRQAELNGYNVVDLRAGVDFGRFSLEVYAKNLANSAGRIDASIPPGYPAAAEFPNGAAGAAVIRPRTVGVTLGAGF